jgi:hypothetical protein
MARRIAPTSLTTPVDRGGGVDLHHEDGLDGVRAVGAQAFLHGRRVDGAALRRMEGLDLEAQRAGHLAPAHGEAPRFEDQHALAAAQAVAQRHLPGAVAVGDGDEGMARGPRDRRQLGQHRVGELDQRAFVDVRHRPVHGGENPVGDHRRAGDGDERAAELQRHGTEPSTFGPARRLAADAGKASGESLMAAITRRDAAAAPRRHGGGCRALRQNFNKST